MTDATPNVVEMLNQHLGGFNQAIGLRFIRATGDAYEAELEVGDHHRQPYGIVHGGVYAAVIETLCSTGAALAVMPEGKSAVGLENSTTFLRAVREGKLRATVKPLFKGRRSHVWEGAVHDDHDRLVATGRVRLMILEAGAEAAGVPVAVK